MSLWSTICNKAFKGNGKVKLGNPNVITKATTGAPTSAARVGTLLWNTYDKDAYICTVATGTWVKINA